jgi:hypothetical protein
MSDQGRLFDPERYPPVRVAALLRLPESNARSFAIASALGSILDAEGKTNKLKSAKEATGVLISQRRTSLVLDVLSIQERRWRQLVDDWATRQIAHRCRLGVVVLFTMPFLEECPSCHQEIEATRLPPSARAKPRGRPFGSTTTDQNGTTTAAETAVLLPRGGATTAAAPAQLLPPLGTVTPPHKTGLLTRDAKGLGGQGSSLSSDSEGSPSGEALNRAERCECGAISRETGYWGHAQGCLRFYGREP